MPNELRGSQIVGPCMFSMDTDAPYAANLLEAVLVVAARLGVYLKWGTYRGGELVLVMSGWVPQSEIADMLSLKVNHPVQAAPVSL